MLAALLPRAVGVDEIVLDIVNRGIETDVDEGIAALFDAKVECIGSGYGFVKLVISCVLMWRDLYAEQWLV